MGRACGRAGGAGLSRRCLVRVRELTRRRLAGMQGSWYPVLRHPLGLREYLPSLPIPPPLARAGFAPPASGRARSRSWRPTHSDRVASHARTAPLASRTRAHPSHGCALRAMRSAAHGGAPTTSLVSLVWDSAVIHQVNRRRGRSVPGAAPRRPSVLYIRNPPASTPSLPPSAPSIPRAIPIAIFSLSSPPLRLLNPAPPAHRPPAAHTYSPASQPPVPSSTAAPPVLFVLFSSLPLLPHVRTRTHAPHGSDES